MEKFEITPHVEKFQISPHLSCIYIWNFSTWQIFLHEYNLWYLSQISQIIFVEKNLSCGEISDFRKEFEQLMMEIYRNICRFCSKFVWRKICVEEKWQIWGLQHNIHYHHHHQYDFLPVLTAAHSLVHVVRSPTTKESGSPPESGAFPQKNLLPSFSSVGIWCTWRVWHRILLELLHQVVLDRFELDLSILQRRGMFSRLVQAVHQFIILTGASSSHRLAKCGCTKKAGWPPPSPELACCSWSLQHPSCLESHCKALSWGES